MIRFKILALAAILLLAASGNDTRQFRGMEEDDQHRGPDISSPPVEMTPFGDRVSPYAPYHHPDRGNRV